MDWCCSVWITNSSKCKSFVANQIQKGIEPHQILLVIELLSPFFILYCQWLFFTWSYIIMHKKSIFPDQHLPGADNYWWHTILHCIHLSVWSNDMAWQCNDWVQCRWYFLCKPPSKWYKQCQSSGLFELPNYSVEKPGIPTQPPNR